MLKLQGWEWIVTGSIAIILILWGPSKIPELVKAIGKAIRKLRNFKEENNTAIAKSLG